MSKLHILKKEAQVALPNTGETYIADDGTVSMVLEDDHDTNYEPTQEELTEYAEWLGMTLPDEEDLLWIAKEGLKAPLPKEWKPCKTDAGEVYYFNFKTGESIWNHPLDGYFKDKFQSEKEKLVQRRSGKIVDEPLAKLPQRNNIIMTEHGVIDAKSFIIEVKPLSAMMDNKKVTTADKKGDKKKKHFQPQEAKIKDVLSGMSSNPSSLSYSSRAVVFSPAPISSNSVKKVDIIDSSSKMLLPISTTTDNDYITTSNNNMNNTPAGNENTPPHSIITNFPLASKFNLGGENPSFRTAPATAAITTIITNDGDFVATPLRAVENATDVFSPVAMNPVETFSTSTLNKKQKNNFFISSNDEQTNILQIGSRANTKASIADGFTSNQNMAISELSSSTSQQLSPYGYTTMVSTYDNVNSRLSKINSLKMINESSTVNTFPQTLTVNQSTAETHPGFSSLFNTGPSSFDVANTAAGLASSFVNSSGMPPPFLGEDGAALKPLISEAQRDLAKRLRLDFERQFERDHQRLKTELENSLKKLREETDASIAEWRTKTSDRLAIIKKDKERELSLDLERRKQALEVHTRTTAADNGGRCITELENDIREQEVALRRIQAKMGVAEEKSTEMRAALEATACGVEREEYGVVTNSGHADRFNGQVGRQLRREAETRSKSGVEKQICKIEEEISELKAAYQREQLSKTRKATARAEEELQSYRARTLFSLASSSLAHQEKERLVSGQLYIEEEESTVLDGIQSKYEKELECVRKEGLSVAQEERKRSEASVRELEEELLQKKRSTLSKENNIQERYNFNNNDSGNIDNKLRQRAEIQATYLRVREEKLKSLELRRKQLIASIISSSPSSDITRAVMMDETPARICVLAENRTQQRLTHMKEQHKVLIQHMNEQFSAEISKLNEKEQHQHEGIGRSGLNISSTSLLRNISASNNHIWSLESDVEYERQAQQLKYASQEERLREESRITDELAATEKIHKEKIEAGICHESLEGKIDSQTAEGQKEHQSFSWVISAGSNLSLSQEEINSLHLPLLPDVEAEVAKQCSFLVQEYSEKEKRLRAIYGSWIAFTSLTTVRNDPAGCSQVGEGTCRDQKIFIPSANTIIGTSSPQAGVCSGDQNFIYLNNTHHTGVPPTKKNNATITTSPTSVPQRLPLTGDNNRSSCHYYNYDASTAAPFATADSPFPITSSSSLTFQPYQQQSPILPMDNSPPHPSQNYTFPHQSHSQEQLFLVPRVCHSQQHSLFSPLHTSSISSLPFLRFPSFPFIPSHYSPYRMKDNWGMASTASAGSFFMKAGSSDKGCRTTAFLTSIVLVDALSRRAMKLQQDILQRGEALQRARWQWMTDTERVCVGGEGGMSRSTALHCTGPGSHDALTNWNGRKNFCEEGGVWE